MYPHTELHAQIAQRYGGFGDVLGVYHLPGVSHVETIIGRDFDGRLRQLSISAPASADGLASVFDNIDDPHAILAPGMSDPAAVAGYLRAILTPGEITPTPDDVLALRGSGNAHDIGAVTLHEVTRQRAVGTVHIDGHDRGFTLRLPNLPGPQRAPSTDYQTSALHLTGTNAQLTAQPLVLAELIWQTAAQPD
ncbi:hypothetical protein ACUY3K_02700 [Corynebacterium uberis]|uniref:hypothetical protein n=1 Tax=Corynebacterium TaxID=1716 RepID=UPI001D0B8899|nr:MULTISPECIES: hypothetical protein [Corynebacterium]MCZ9309864.1 hypothetical protein [Corynebacterium sp. c6VSa_13]UDL73211.1 hypothetical protein LH391_08905 [Corynebacterium uberis]UDL75912.1 hypothetical protein LH393_00485 [Corynebacterium uberis]UDL78124.1 hypothetical protein LH394_00480 [Corynebacterium uberis]UDL80407.1 hypothetical protein LH392_00910 [Corynebacterium uberis]